MAFTVMVFCMLGLPGLVLGAVYLRRPGAGLLASVGALAVVVAIVRHLQATDSLALVIVLPIAGLQLCTGVGWVALIRHRRATDRHL